MANKTENGKAYCPFYIDVNKGDIKCEGVIKHTITLTKFPTMEARKEHFYHFCVDTRCRACPVFEALMKHYS